METVNELREETEVEAGPSARSCVQKGREFLRFAIRWGNEVMVNVRTRETAEIGSAPTVSRGG